MNSSFRKIAVLFTSLFALTLLGACVPKSNTAVTKPKTTVAKSASRKAHSPKVHSSKKPAVKKKKK